MIEIKSEDGLYRLMGDEFFFPKSSHMRGNFNERLGILLGVPGVVGLYLTRNGYEAVIYEGAPSSLR